MSMPAKRRRVDSKESSIVTLQPAESFRRVTRQSKRASDRGSGPASEVPAGRLSFDVLLLIFSFLTSPADRKAVLLTCKDWYAAMSQPSLWRDSCIIIRKASSPLSLWRLLEARQIHSVSIRTEPCLYRSFLGTLHKLEKVAPRSVTHVSVEDCSMNICDRFDVISSAFVQLPHLKSLSLELPSARHLALWKARQLPNIVELNLSHAGYFCRELDIVMLCDAVGSTLQHLSLKGFKICRFVNGCLIRKVRPQLSVAASNAVIEIDRMPSLVSLELTDCWSDADCPVVTKIDDKNDPNHSPEFCLSEIRITRTTLQFEYLYSSSDTDVLSFPVIGSEVLRQLTVLEISNYELSSTHSISHNVTLNLSSYTRLLKSQ